MDINKPTSINNLPIKSGRLDPDVSRLIDQISRVNPKLVQMKDPANINLLLGYKGSQKSIYKEKLKSLKLKLGDFFKDIELIRSKILKKEFSDEEMMIMFNEDLTRKCFQDELFELLTQFYTGVSADKINSISKLPKPSEFIFSNHYRNSCYAFKVALTTLLQKFIDDGYYSANKTDELIASYKIAKALEGKT